MQCSEVASISVLFGHEISWVQDAGDVGNCDVALLLSSTNTCLANVNVFHLFGATSMGPINGTLVVVQEVSGFKNRRRR